MDGYITMKTWLKIRFDKEYVF